MLSINSVLSSKIEYGKHVFRLFVIDRFFLRMWLGDRRRIRLSLSNRSLSLMLPESPCVLIVVHNNCFTEFAGVEKETFSLVRWLTKKHPDKRILLYSYDFPENKHVLHCIRKGKMEVTGEYKSGTSPDTILKRLLGTFDIKLAVIEHLQWHSLNYLSLLENSGIRIFMYIHEFFYYCPYPYMPVPQRVKGENRNIVCDITRADCGTCSGMDNFPEIDIIEWRKKVKSALLSEFVTVCFVSEFVRDNYVKMFNLGSKKEYTVSYPDFL